MIKTVTRVEAQATHDVQFSYHEAEPLYLGAGGQVEVTQRVVGQLDAVVIA
jgi:hypothetical protein